MAEKTFEVVPVGVDYICDECKQGTMIFTKFHADSSHETIPFEHTCNQCNHKQCLSEKFPTVRFNRKQ